MFHGPTDPDRRGLMQATVKINLNKLLNFHTRKGKREKAPRKVEERSRKGFVSAILSGKVKKAYI